MATQKKQGKTFQQQWEEFLNQIDASFSQYDTNRIYMIIGGSVVGLIILFAYFLYPMAIDYLTQNKNSLEKLKGDVVKLNQDIKQLNRDIIVTSRKIKQEQKNYSKLVKQLKEVDQAVSQLNRLQFDLERLKKWLQLTQFIADATSATGLKFTSFYNIVYLPPKKKKEDSKGLKGKLAKIKKQVEKKAKKVAKNAKVKMEKTLEGKISPNNFLKKRLEMNLTGAGPYKNVVDFLHYLETQPALVQIKGFSMDKNRTFTIQVEVYGFEK